MNQPPTHEQLHESQLELLTASYSQAKAYFNLVIVGGYASFFGLWKLTEDLLEPRQKLLAALLMSVSVVTFVFWEISQMILTNQSLIGIANAVNDPANFLEKIQEHAKSSQKRMLKIRWFWPAQLFVTISTAVGGGGVLMYAFVSGLLK